MNWELVYADHARKRLRGIRGKDRELLLKALAAMAEDPFSGDIARLQNHPAAWRRRVGAWRIFFTPHPGEHRIVVSAVERRTSTTY